MDSNQFDRLTVSVSRLLTRRALAGMLGAGVLAASVPADAKKKKKKKAKFNEFGCVDVGKFCKNASQCCSGICQGKKGKKKCKAHDQSTCQSGQREGFCGGDDVVCETSGGTEGRCDTTTGKSGYCSAAPGECTPCTKDADCTAICGPGAACILCTGCDESNGLACVGQNPGGCAM